MSQAAASTLMERKIAAGRPRADPSIMTPERALQAAFARASEKQMKMPSRMPGCAEMRLNGAEIAEILPEHALLALLDGPRDGLGLLALAPAALSVLIEVLTLGRVADRAPPPRRPTRTDAALVSGFINSVLGECETLLAHEDDLTWLGGFRYGAHLPDPRPLALMFEAPAYRVFRMTLTFGTAADPKADLRQGEILLALPAVGQGALPVPRTDGDRPAATPEGNSPQTGDAGWDLAMEQAVLPVSVEVRAVLSRVTLTLAELIQLEAGISLPLPTSALSHVQIEGGDGRVVTCGQLGQGNGRRVVRLSELDASMPVTLPINPTELVAARDQPLARSALTERRPTEADLTAPIDQPRPASGADPANPDLAEGAMAKAG